MLLSVQSISKQIGALQILQDVNLEIEGGTINALIGPSGSGKTTLLQIIGLLDHQSAGLILIDNQDTSNLSDYKRSNFRLNTIGFVYQFHHLLEDFTALENVMMPMLIANMGDKDARMRALELLGSVGLEDRTQHKPHMLSGGEKQRIAIARALANKPKILLADEPTGNLDSETSKQVFDVMLKMIRTHKMAALIATHNKELSNATDQIYAIKDGSIYSSK